jgi:hypothetical protein
MADARKQKRQQYAGAMGKGAIISRHYYMPEVTVCQEKTRGISAFQMPAYQA